MSSERGRRPYRLKRRAEAMDQTRRRIADAALGLHATVGPARVTISAIAEHAGVERATVYRHFPDELSLFRACVTHGLTLYPVPDPRAWRRIKDPEERVRRGLRDLYAYYRLTQSIWTNVSRDLPLLPALQQANADAGVFDWFATIRGILLRPWGVRARRRKLLGAAIRLATDFGTWRSLVAQEGLTDEEAIEAMVAMMRCVAQA